MTIRSGTQIVSALTAAVLLIGCGRTNSSSGDGEKVRYHAISSKVKTMDPAQIGDVTSSGVASQIYDPLYQYHYLNRPYNIIPCAAAGMPKFSDDEMTVTVQLRNDMIFHDDECFPNGQGRAVEAEDFIYSWKRIADLKIVSGNWWVFDDHIVGLNEFRDYTGTVSKGEVDYDRPIEGLEALDRHTIQIKLTKPWPQITYLLAHLPTAAVPREAVDKYGDEFMNHPIGTGPYMLDKWHRGSSIILVRNPSYRDEKYPSEGELGDGQRGLLVDAGKKLPLVDRIEIKIVEEDQPYWLLFMKGKIDRAGIPKDNFDKAVTPGRELTPELAKKGITLQIYDDPTTFWYGFNMEDPVVGTNLPLRQAMNAALDRREYIELFLNGRGQPARGFLPPLFKEYNPDIDSPYTVHDIEKARNLVQEAERVHGGPLPAITISFGSNDTTARQAGQYLQRAMEKAGIRLEPDYMDWPTLQQKVRTKSVQMYGMGWMADYPDAGNFMTIFHGPNTAPGPNGFNYQNDQFDALFKKVVVMPDTPQRTEIYQKMEQIVVADLPFILTFHREAFVLSYPWLNNYKPHVFGYGLMKYQNIDIEMRQQKIRR